VKERFTGTVQEVNGTEVGTAAVEDTTLMESATVFPMFLLDPAPTVKGR